MSKILLHLHPKGYKLKIMSVSEYVKEMRRQYSLTQTDLSEKAGVGLRFVRELEQGKQTLRMDKVNQVLALFGAKLAPMTIQKSESEL